MDSVQVKKRTNVEGDRLSNLPDDLIHKILSFIDIKQAIKTSRLSSRWRYIWTTMPYLNLSTNDFSRLPNFSKFVKHLLSNRNNQSEMFSVDLTFRGKDSHEFVWRVLAYAFSHNVQQLNITGLPGFKYPLAKFPPSFFRSKSLKHLTFCGPIDKHRGLTKPTWTMPALTTLNLHGVSFYDNKCTDLFSKCPNLTNLTLKNFTTSNSFVICHPGLSSLTLEDGHNRVEVITPQLKNLAIRYWRGIRLVSAPNLSSLRYTDDYYLYKDNDVGPLQLPTDLLHLEKVDICIDSLFENKAYTKQIVCMLQHFHCVKYLTLNLELVERFSSSVEIISNQYSPFVNLKNLKIYPIDVAPEKQTREKVTISNEVKNFFLNSSPCVTFTMVTHEEIRAVKTVTSARNLLKELEDKLKEYIETNMEFKTMLKTITALLKKLPTCHRDKLEARFSGLGTMLSDRINQSHNEFYEHATSSQLSLPSVTTDVCQNTPQT